ncbi:MAG: VanW family protein, partial [Clostridia bacterium]
RIEVVAKLEYKFPKITEQQLHLNTVLRSSFKTYYGYSAPARKSNIGRALSQINGTVLENKQEFSFNNIVGARSRSRGYVEAPIIINGSFVSGVGGGVCQVSTTIYNAALLADLEVKNVAKHSLPVKYAPPSFDAMVSSVTDFKFINNTGEKIYICATCDGNYINISIYGKPLDCEIRLESIKVRDIPFKTDYIDNINAELGVEKVLSSGISGIESKGYIVKSIGSKVVSTKLIRHDIYAPQARLVSIGTKITADINENAKQNDFEISQAENQ